MAPYGILQSLLRDVDLRATLRAVAAVVPVGGFFAIDLVPDLPAWQEYERRVSLQGPRAGGGRLTLVESVRQDQARRLTIFDQEFVEQGGRRRRTHRFSLVFRTLSVQDMARRLERVGFAVDAVLGDYQGHAWHPGADVWVLLARRRSSAGPVTRA